jgi:Tfp pilus assembly protein FimV
MGWFRRSKKREDTAGAKAAAETVARLEARVAELEARLQARERELEAAYADVDAASAELEASAGAVREALAVIDSLESERKGIGGTSEPDPVTDS